MNSAIKSYHFVLVWVLLTLIAASWSVVALNLNSGLNEDNPMGLLPYWPACVFLGVGLFSLFGIPKERNRISLAIIGVLLFCAVTFYTNSCIPDQTICPVCSGRGKFVTPGRDIRCGNCGGGGLVQHKKLHW